MRRRCFECCLNIVHSIKCTVYETDWTWFYALNYYDFSKSSLDLDTYWTAGFSTMPLLVIDHFFSIRCVARDHITAWELISLVFFYCILSLFIALFLPHVSVCLFVLCSREHCSFSAFQMHNINCNPMNKWTRREKKANPIKSRPTACFLYMYMANVIATKCFKNWMRAQLICRPSTPANAYKSRNLSSCRNEYGPVQCLRIRFIRKASKSKSTTIEGEKRNKKKSVATTTTPTFLD